MSSLETPKKQWRRKFLTVNITYNKSTTHEQAIFHPEKMDFQTFYNGERCKKSSMLMKYNKPKVKEHDDIMLGQIGQII